PPRGRNRRAPPGRDRLLPAGRARRRVGGGRPLERGPAPPRPAGPGGGRGRTGRPAAARPGHGRGPPAGGGGPHRLLPGLAMGAAPGRELGGRLTEALDGADLVVVENVCSLPRNPAATAALAGVLAGRPAILHHHDLPWQREEFGDLPGWPPDDPAWRHVTINEHSRKELADRGLA